MLAESQNTRLRSAFATLFKVKKKYGITIELPYLRTIFLGSKLRADYEVVVIK